MGDEYTLVDNGNKTSNTNSYRDRTSNVETFSGASLGLLLKVVTKCFDSVLNCGGRYACVTGSF